MSSFNKAAKSAQKTHKERSQPAARVNLGLLEKKKDYVLRARDHEQKKRTIRNLRKKAQNKNPDEFYFHMINSQIDEDGKHREKVKDEELTEDQMKLMQSQDLRYVSYKRALEAKKIEKLKSSLHLLDAAGKPRSKHTFFVDTVEEVRKFDVAERLDTSKELLNRSYNRPRMNSLKNISIEVEDDLLQEIEKKKEESYRQLSKRIERERMLFACSQKLEVKRHLANKKLPAAKRIKPGTVNTAPIYKWKQERQR